MSYDINLMDPIAKETLELDAPHQMKCGTFCLGGDQWAHLNITYNYSNHYYRIFGQKGIRALYGMTGAESIPFLDEGMAQLGDDIHPRYWISTEGNAKRALLQLRALALLRPDGVWSGD